MNELSYILLICINSNPLLEVGLTKEYKVHYQKKGATIFNKEIKYLVLDYKSPTKVGPNHKALEHAFPITKNGKILSDVFQYYEINLAGCKTALSTLPLTKGEKKILQLGELLLENDPTVFMEKIETLNVFEFENFPKFRNLLKESLF